jgi:hypothetical protein
VPNITTETRLRWSHYFSKEKAICLGGAFKYFGWTMNGLASLLRAKAGIQWNLQGRDRSWNGQKRTG